MLVTDVASWIDDAERGNCDRSAVKDIVGRSFIFGVPGP